MYLGMVMNNLSFHTSNPSGKLFSGLYRPLVMASSLAASDAQSYATSFHRNFSCNFVAKPMLTHTTNKNATLKHFIFVFVSLKFPNLIKWNEKKKQIHNTLNNHKRIERHRQEEKKYIIKPTSTTVSLSVIEFVVRSNNLWRSQFQVYWCIHAHMLTKTILLDLFVSFICSGCYVYTWLISQPFHADWEVYRFN